MMERISDCVSFIIPAYNAAAHLRETLSSVLSQDYPDIEVIVVDDGSEDASFEIARQHVDKRVRGIRQLNAGPSAARNNGFRHSTGEFVWYLDADDLLVSGCVPALIESLQSNPGAGFAVGRWRTTDAQGNDSSADQYIPVGTSAAQLYSQMLLRTVFPVGSAVFRASAIEACGGWDESLWCAEDRDFYLRVLDARFEFHSTNIDVFRYRIHDSNATFNTERIQTHANRFLDKWFGPCGIASGNLRTLAPMARAIVNLYIARQCAITNQPNQAIMFTHSAAELLLEAHPCLEEATRILWETSSSPYQKILRTSLWKRRPDAVQKFCNVQAKIALRAGKPVVALTWLIERMLYSARVSFWELSSARVVGISTREVGSP